MGIVSTIPERCRRCYTCIRECPAKAIKVEHGQAMVIEERCIACGNCVKVCAQKAKRIEDATEVVKGLLEGRERSFACLAPSFPAAFPDIAPGKLISALRHVGFDEVWEVAFGAQLVSREYAKLFDKARRSGERVITTPCPAIVSYISRYMPSLFDSLAPIVSPMVATARAIRKRFGDDCSIVFIGPCIAKKNEAREPAVEGEVDAVLSFKELARMFDEMAVLPDKMRISASDSPPCHLARSFPISGGLLRSAGLSSDILENDIVITEGKDRVLSALKELADNRAETRLFDVLFCEGCINGPKMPNELSVFARKEIVADYVNEQNRLTTQRQVAETLAEYESLDLSRGFTLQNLVLKEPTEEEINQILQSMRKYALEDQLNCGACGYASCRDKAIAVCQGLAEAEMCLPYLVDELEMTCSRLEESHQRLASAQQRLVETERLASMGQISAAVAHEINNPLGTILIYSHMMLKELQQSDPKQSDVKMIVEEASRCRNIVRGLLDFSRRSRLSKAPTDLRKIMDEVARIEEAKASNAKVRLEIDVDNDLPTMIVDETQMKQALVNLVDNAIDAIDEGGLVRMSAAPAGDGNVTLKVEDNGHGMSEDNASKLFVPFFTTKEVGKGTGLGMAIVYGIVKMHSGEISVQSKEGEGTTVTITVPVDGESKSAAAQILGQDVTD